MVFKKARQTGKGKTVRPTHMNDDTQTPKDLPSTSEKKTAAEDRDIKDPNDLSTEIVYPSGLKLALLVTAIFVSMFLVSLDRLIISTAIPQITNEFNSGGDIGWYGAAYLITSCAFQLVFGKLYKVFGVKATFLMSIFLFEIGSAICGAAPSSIAFILGRAIAGLGSGGVLSGVIVVLVYAIPLHKRPKYQGFFGAVFGISSVAGPLVGGAFTTKVAWRWCFYINLPLGALVMCFIFFLLQIPDRPETRMPIKDKLRQLNALGLFALLPGIVCLLLALQWGGITYPWSEGRVTALLALGILLLMAFILIQVWKPEQATLPPRIFVQRSIASGFWVTSCIGAHRDTFVYYLPVWFQAVKNLSAVESGIHLLPMMMSIVVASIICGILTSRIGYYTPFLILGVSITSLGAGLLNTLNIDASKGQWIGFQILYGFGFGLSAQAPNMAAQTVLPREDVPMGVSYMLFGQQLFGAIAICVGQNLLDNQLAGRLAGIPGITRALIPVTGATELLDRIPAKYHALALQAYNDSLRVCFRVGLIVACLSILGALCMEWRSVKKNTPPKNSEGVQAAEEGKGKGGLSEKSATEAKKNAPPTTPEVVQSSERSKGEDDLGKKATPERQSEGDQSDTIRSGP